MRRERDSENQEATEMPKRRFRRRYVVLAAFVLLLVALFAAPILVAKTGLRNSLANWVLSDLDGEIQIGSASFNWFYPVELSDVRLADSDGKMLAQVARVTSQKPLLAFLGNRKQLGNFTVQQPRATVEVREGGSNLEDAIHELLNSDGETTEIQCSIDVVDGEITITRQGVDGLLKLESITATVSVDLGGNEPLSVSVAGVTRDKKGEGRFETELSSRPALTQISIATERLPMSLFGLALLRLGTDSNVGGDLDADIDLAFAPGDMSVLTVRRLEARQVTVQSRQWLGEDRLALGVLKASGKSSFGDGQLQLDQCSLTSDVAELDAHGTFDIDAFATADVAQMLGDQDFRIAGKVDLGLLANMLPDTLSLKDDTRITGGSVELNAFSRVEAERRRWVATLATSALTAISNGREISWDQPLQVTLAAVNQGEGPAIETLSCRSDFLTATAKGTLQNGSLTANGNLDRLSQQLGRFVDLSKMQLAGGLSATANWQQQADQRVHFLGNVVLSSFALSTPDGTPWTEDRLTLDGDVTALVGETGVERLDSGRIVMHAGDDHLELRLEGARQLDNANSPWPVSAVLKGDLATWIPRLQPWVSLSSWKPQGQIDLTATGQVKNESLQIDKAKMNLDEFRITGNGLNIHEPRVIVEATGTWEHASKRLALKDTTLTSSTVALRAETAEARFGEAIEFAGGIAYRCELTRLTAWFHDPAAKPPATRLEGHATGAADVRFQKRLLDAGLNAQVHDLVVSKRDVESSTTRPISNETNSWRSVWQEKLVTVNSNASFDLARGNLTLKAAKVSGASLALDASGTLSELEKECVADLKGTVEYDLPAISQILRGLLGPNIDFVGREQGSFAIKGPLRQLPSTNATQTASVPAEPTRVVSNKLLGEAQFGWAAANLYGFPIGKGSLAANLREGVVEVQPLKVAVGQGRINFAPRVYLNNVPASLVVDRGRVLENVQITPEISRGWLKFIAPFVADATEANGTFSLDLAGAKVPLSAPAEGNVRGTLLIKQAAIGPGAMGRELLVLGQQIQGLLRGQALSSLTGTQTAQWLQLPEQQVEFHLVDGRVHHENLHLVVSDIEIVTSGSVGMDQSVDLVARVAIQDSWVAQNGLLAGLKGKTLEVPIKGTLGRPLADSRVIANVARQYFQGTAERAVEREIQKGLERGLQQLFGPPR